MNGDPTDTQSEFSEPERPGTDDRGSNRSNTGHASPAGKKSLVLDELGSQVGEAVLNIDYAIIEHFSDHLYSSENKAVEELVANGFDAMAENVYVYTPGRFVKDRVVVWDDGTSMNVSGLEDLWQIADSPKRRTEDRTTESVDERPPRKMIGKFGIGKLASYVVGGRIAHLCCKKGSYFAVGVDYAEIHGDETRARATREDPAKAPIRRLTEEEANKYVQGLFAFDNEKSPLVLDELGRSSWTLAVIEELKVDLKSGRLSWVLGNGLPARPDFTVWVNDEKVEPSVEKGEVDKWGFDHKELREQVETNWNRAQGDGRVTGAFSFGTEVGLDPSNRTASIPYVELPEMGKVWGVTRIYDKSLLKGRKADLARSHGFFIMVRGRLLNQTDATFHLPIDPQYGAFNRAQFILHADGLDRALLADRRSIKEDTQLKRELEVLQRSMYQVARVAIDKRDEDKADDDIPGFLPTKSRDHYRRPVATLLAMEGDDALREFRLLDPSIERRPLSDDEAVARIGPDMDGFEVNDEHPFFRSLDALLGGKSKKSRAFYRWYDLLAISDLLLKGHLYDRGIDGESVDDILKWRDGLLRQFADFQETAPDELATALERASYEGDRVFEDALAEVLREIGFDAKRIGGPGREDVALRATFGAGSYSLIFEAKGSSGPVASADANIGTVNSQREDALADHAVVVAREFVGFRQNPNNDDARVLKNCRAVDGKVSIMTVEALNELLAAWDRCRYPLDSLRDVFFRVEPPAEKLKLIKGLQAPQKLFDCRKLLDVVWETQKGPAQRDRVSYRTVWQKHFWNWEEAKGNEEVEEFTLEKFERALFGLEILAAPLVDLEPGNQTIVLRQSPERIEEQLRSA